jgi:hypothetical protein
MVEDDREVAEHHRLLDSPVDVGRRGGHGVHRRPEVLGPHPQAPLSGCDVRSAM